MPEDSRAMRAGRVPTKKVEREGSPWTGLWAVVTKEMADHLTSIRMEILEILILLTAGGTVFTAVSSISSNTSNNQFLFLQLFTTSKDPLPPFVQFLVFLVPLIAIALTFDSINGEFQRSTMSRILAQPIYRDALLLGKFLAAFFTQALAFSAIWLLIIGAGLLGLGVPPTGDEVARSLMFLVATIFYGGIWLAMAMTFSIVFRSAATAALASIAVWLFFTIFWNIISTLLAQTLSPVQYGTTQELLNQAQAQIVISRISPNVLYEEVMVALLQPTVRSMGIVLPAQLEGAVLGTPLPFGQSMALIWPQLTGLIALTILLFVLGYVLFQRREIRA